MLTSSTKSSSPPYDGRRNTIVSSPVRKLGFQLVDLINFGPLSFLKPNPSNGDPAFHLLKPRCALTLSLSNLSQPKWLSNAFVRRLQMALNTLLSLWLYKNSLRTLPLVSPRIINHELISFIKKGCLCPTQTFMRTLPIESSRISTHVVKGLKKNGIMIMSLKSGDYRSFFSPFIPYPRFPEPLYVQLKFLMETPPTLKSLEPNFNPSFFNLTLSVLLKTKSTRPALHLLLSYWLHALCGLLNLLGQGLQVRENPPVLLQFDIYLWHLLALVLIGRSVFNGLKFYGLSPCNPSYSLDDFKPIYCSTSAIPRILWFEDYPRSNGSYLLIWASHQPTLDLNTMVPGTSAIALLVYLVSASCLALAPSLTSKCLMTVTIFSFIDSFDDDHSSLRDLSCSYLLHSICFIALMVLISMSFIFYFMVLGNTFLCNLLNFEICESPPLYLDLV
ncbi:PREDICTED: uncharacterized protein LOC109130197 isoform X2 [Camelina sativa]|uniref:Uncharacterized protein LOC109130197 isoform X1 n=1 Tax=Camelina sativa TaxID=90675 RepID=A0ABM1R7I4_CAMSA|nr:PREDICTED: uncharacterized protein LOC109130197 isoform X1 [Camelina sativa]XP_019094972.1 PREDICTED: uncharacterized protein LOC109130197 isoform X2 [Camelina sativa]